MNSPKKILSVLVTVVAVGLTTSGPAGAGTLEATCTGENSLLGTPVPTTNDHVVLKGEGWCLQSPGELVNGNVRVTEKAQFLAQGTIYGNVEVNTELDMPVPIPSSPRPSFPYDAALLARAIVYGNVIQEGNGSIRVGAVFGNAEMKGLGRLVVGQGGGRADAAVTGNVINEGAGCILVLTRLGRTDTIGGNVESKGGGGGVVSPFRSSWPGSSGCVAAPATPSDGGPIFINGNTCGVEVDPDSTGLVTVNGEVKESC